MIFACPVCYEPLVRDARRYTCANAHHFDMAKEGYVNLLLANQKNSFDPGDSKAMIQARRLFLDCGYFQPLVESLVQILPDALDDKIMLDVGCGEGYYIAQMKSAHRYGLDISKNAVRYAAKRYKDVQFAVASVMNLPVLSEAVDVIFNIFAPLDIAEAEKALKIGGSIAKVRPNKNHLLELKQFLYDAPQQHEVADLLSDVSDNLHHIDTVETTYIMQVSTQEHVQALLRMTPYFWHASPEQQARVSQLEQLSLTADFRIDVYQRI